MIKDELDLSIFPRLADGCRGSWAPIFFEPIPNSGERLCIAIAVVGEDGFHLEQANSFSRLDCLYGAEAARGLTFAIAASLAALRADLAGRGLEALTHARPVVSGLSVGEVGAGHGADLRDLASLWLAACSSLHDAGPSSALRIGTSEAAAEASGVSPQSERLHELVFEYVVRHRPGLEQFFREDLRPQIGARRRLSAAHRVRIDFAGSRVVANFATLRPSEAARSVGVIKQRLWDLKVDRDREEVSTLPPRKHEMFVQHPSWSDPQLSEKQARNMNEALDELEHQADQEELDLLKVTEITQIGDRLLKQEGFGAPTQTM